MPSYEEKHLHVEADMIKKDISSVNAEKTFEEHSIASKKCIKTDTVVDGGYGWVIVLGSFISHFFLLGWVRSFGVVYVELLRKFNQSAKQTALLAALFNTFRMIFAPLVSIFCKRYSCRLSMVLGGIALCSGIVISAFATDMLYLNISYGVLCGIVSSLVFTPSFIMVGNYFDKKKGIAMSLGTIGAGAGAVVMAPLITYLFDVYGYFGSMLIFGVIQLHQCVAGALFRPVVDHRNKPIVKVVHSQTEKYTLNDPSGFSHITGNEKQETETSVSSVLKDCNSEPQIETAVGAENMKSLITNQKDGDTHAMNIVIKSSVAIETENKSKQSSEDLHTKVDAEKDKQSIGMRLKRSLVKKLKLFRSITMCLYCMCITAVPITIGMMIWFVSDNVHMLGATDTQSALVVSVFSAFDVVGRLLWGIIFDLPTFRYRRRMLFPLLGLACGILVITMAFMPNYYSVFVCISAFGIFEGGYHSQRVTIVSEFVEKSMLPETVGISIFFQGIGNSVSPLLGGFSKDTYGNYRLGYFIAGGIQVTVSLMFLVNYILEKKKTSNRTINEGK